MNKPTPTWSPCCLLLARVFSLAREEALHLAKRPLVAEPEAVQHLDSWARRPGRAYPYEQLIACEKNNVLHPLMNLWRGRGRYPIHHIVASLRIKGEIPCETVKVLVVCSR